MAWKCCFIRAPERWNYGAAKMRSEEHTSELQSQSNLVCRLLLEKKKSHMSNLASLLRPWRRWRECMLTRSTLLHGAVNCMSLRSGGDRGADPVAAAIC